MNWFIHGFAVRQINAKHVFLARFIGTQENEDISYIEANKLNLVATLTTCLCSILEIGLYFAYNKLVKTMFEYHKKTFLAPPRSSGSSSVRLSVCVFVCVTFMNSSFNLHSILEQS